MRSTDNGAHWATINNGLTDLNVYALAINSSEHIFAGTSSGVFRSTDNGNNWTAVSSGISISSIAINSSNAIFVGTFGAGVYRSLDNGANWTTVNTGLTNYHIKSLAINSSGHIFAGVSNNDGIFRSINNGTNWVPVNTGLTTNIYIVQAIAINSTGHLFAGTWGAGVFRSINNGSNWIGVNSGLIAVKVNALDINSSDHLFAGVRAGVFRSLNNGTSWSSVNTGLGYSEVYALVINSSDDIFAGTWGAGVFRSTDNGANWTAVNSGLTVSSVNALNVNSSDHVFVGTSGGVFRSTNNGANWVAVNNGITNIDINTLAINSSNYIFAGTWGGGVFRSTDNGNNWIPINTGLTPSHIVALAIDSNDHIFAGTTNGVYRSTDNGDNWTDLSIVGSVSSLVINYSDHIFAAVWGGGVFRSTDNGVNWMAINSGLSTLLVPAMATNSNGYIFAGTRGNGIFSSIQSTIIPFVLTNNASNITQTSVRLNGSVNPNRLNSTVKFQWGTSTAYGNEIPGNPSLVSGTTTQTVTADLTGLTMNTTYHYRVVATSSAGTSNGSDKTFITSTILPIVTTNSATSVTTSSATLNGTVNPNGLSTTVKFRWGTNTNYGNEITGIPSSISGTTTQAVMGNLTGLLANTTYHFLVVATNNQGGEATGNHKNFRTYTSTYTLNNTTTFPTYQNVNDYQSSDYRLIGIPGNHNSSISQLLSGSQGTNWEVYWDNGSSSSDPNVFFNKYDGGARFLCSAGRAFWLINKGTWQISNLSVNSANLNTNGEVEVPLHPGWNIITNPFDISIPWTSIQTSNSISTPIWNFQGSLGYQQANEFLPYIGYYFDNQSNLSVLRILYSLTYENSLQTVLQEPVIWRVHILFSQQEFSDHSVSLGVATRAKVGLDDLDYRKPRIFSDMPSIYFPHFDWGGQFATDIRGKMSGNEKWEMEVKCKIGETAQLEFTGINTVPDKFDIYLVYKDDGRWVDLRGDSLFQFIPRKRVSKFKILVGDNNFIMNQLDDVLPEEFSLGQNFPNPFNPTTTFPVLILENCEINLSVYTLLGQRIRTIYQGTMEAGKHWMTWDGRDDGNGEVSAGIYIYRLNTNRDFRYSRKMILLK